MMVRWCWTRSVERSAEIIAPAFSILSCCLGNMDTWRMHSPLWGGGARACLYFQGFTDIPTL